ncbi:hypothetical protein AVEN_9004-1 [Araneus ventricosus]|uniref:Uncharacterized protein n=1 Tax=Araneus ventricosus TaxID=182803 RepID=A0A4Y2DPI3_ARAVE|nr:hypothetical protein AVEN_9004-1 [Araneus ventricosus]
MGRDGDLRGSDEIQDLIPIDSRRRRMGSWKLHGQKSSSSLFSSSEKWLMVGVAWVKDPDAVHGTLRTRHLSGAVCVTAPTPVPATTAGSSFLDNYAHLNEEKEKIPNASLIKLLVIVRFFSLSAVRID